MPLSKDVKDQIIAEYATHEGDTGSPEVQIALLTQRSAAAGWSSSSPSRLPRRDRH